MLKTPFVLGVGLGYVLGARAGRERYEQIVRLARRTKNNPTVAHAAGAATQRGEEILKQAVDKAAEKVPDWVPGSRDANDSASATSAPNGHKNPQGSAPGPAMPNL